MKQRYKRAAMWALGVLPLLAVAVVYGQLPAEVPIHWGNGAVQYGAKWQLFLIAGVNLLLAALLPLLAKIDPKRRNYARFAEVYTTMILLIQVFLYAMVTLLLMEGLQPERLPVPRIVCGMVALLFVLLGNLMPKVKQNFYIGIRTPWALCSEAVWQKTQRLGGKCFFFGGLFLFLLCFVLPEGALPAAFFAVLMAICILPVVMSYLWHRREEGI